MQSLMFVLHGIQVVVISGETGCGKTTQVQSYDVQHNALLNC
jgi:HrpA-like RNA helicase